MRPLAYGALGVLLAAPPLAGAAAAGDAAAGREIYERCASAEKALVRLPGADHFSVYVGETFATAMRHSGDWFGKHLGIPG